MNHIEFAIELLKKGRTVNVIGRGNSMRPYLVHERDKIVFKPVDSVKAGDVVLAKFPNKYIIHRVVKVDGENVTMMGDGCTTCEKCTLNDIFGKAEGFIRKGRETMDRADSFGYKLYAWTWMHLPLTFRKCFLGIHDIIFLSRKDLTRISPTEDETELFVALLKISLWGASTKEAEQILNSKNIGWDVILDMANRQTVTGIIADAVRQLPENLKPGKDICDKLSSFLRKLLMQHEKFNSVAVRSMEIFKANGIPAVLLKGQGTAAHYPNPILRQCGDIDIYVGPENYEKARKCIVELVGEKGVDPHDIKEKHANAHYGNIEIEMHKNAEIHHNIFVKNSYIKYCEHWLNPELCDKARIQDKEIDIPQLQFNTIYTFFHLWHHFVCGGVGLRHVIDWCILLHRAHKIIDNKQLETDINKYKILRGWQTIGWIAVNKLGFPKEEMPCYSDKYEKEALLVWDKIMKGGNFQRPFQKRLGKHHWMLSKIISFCYTVSDVVRLYPLIGHEFLHVLLYMFNRGTNTTIKILNQK